MDKIIFIVNSNAIHLYLWECIKQIHDVFDNIQITVFIDNQLEKPNNYTFNPFISFIDAKFTNLKTNPLSLIDLKKESQSISGLRLVNHSNELSLSDWVIIDNNYKNCHTFNKYSKNGLLRLALNKKEVLSVILSGSKISLNISALAMKSNSWHNVFTVQLKTEIGFKNNVHKLLHNYAVYLVKFLKNSTTNESITTPHPQNNNKANKKRGALQIKAIFYYFKLGFKILHRKIKKEQLNWKIGVKTANGLSFLKQPKNSFWADPFIIKESNGNLLIYFEELKKDGLGKIASVALNPQLEIINKHDILDTNYHVSFPNVFLKDGSYYMIPESSQNNTLQLYKCTQFPFKWEFQMNLMENIKLLDAVWIYHDNLYWIFANKIENFEHDNNEKLYLYYSNDLFSKNWQPHIKNPIVTNASLARNGGNFYHENGKLYRVSQNCLDGYGQNVAINEVKVLNRNNYAEEKVDAVFPVKGYVGCHTLNNHENVSVLDFLQKEKI